MNLPADMFEERGTLSEDKAKSLYKAMLERARARQQTEATKKQNEQKDKQAVLTKAAALNPQEVLKEQMRQVIEEEAGAEK